MMIDIIERHLHDNINSLIFVHQSDHVDVVSQYEDIAYIQCDEGALLVKFIFAGQLVDIEDMWLDFTNPQSIDELERVVEILSLAARRPPLSRSVKCGY